MHHACFNHSLLASLKISVGNPSCTLFIEVSKLTGTPYAINRDSRQLNNKGFHILTNVCSNYECLCTESEVYIDRFSKLGSLSPKLSDFIWTFVFFCSVNIYVEKKFSYFLGFVCWIDGLLVNCIHGTCF